MKKAKLSLCFFSKQTPFADNISDYVKIRLFFYRFKGKHIDFFYENIIFIDVEYAYFFAFLNRRFHALNGNKIDIKRDFSCKTDNTVLPLSLLRFRIFLPRLPPEYRAAFRYPRSTCFHNSQNRN